MRIFLTAGNVNDTIPAGELLADLSADKLLADRAYDSDAVLEQARQQKMEVVIPSRKCRRHQREYDAHVYKERHLVECFFANLKSFRRIATRYDKLAETFRANVMIAACLIWLQ